MRRPEFSSVVVGMITVGIIRNGATYLSQHLRKNDYWAEGEKEVRGEWIGEGARALGLEGPVTDKPFDALRQNRHPKTGEPLTPSDHANRVAFFDIQLSAPKDVSVLAGRRVASCWSLASGAGAEAFEFAAVELRRLLGRSSLRVNHGALLPNYR